MKNLFQSFRKFIDPYYMKTIFYFLLAKQEIGKFYKDNKVDVIYWSSVILYASIMTFLAFIMPGLARTIVCGVLAFMAGYFRFSDAFLVEDRSFLNKLSNASIGTATVLMLLGLFGL